MPADRLTPGEIFDLFDTTTAAIAARVDAVRDRRAKGARPGQYALDLTADEAALEVLHGAQLAVFSEESGHSAPVDARPDLLVIVDPVDGSTNCSLGLGWYATSLCLLDAKGPFAAAVTNLASGVVFRAVRGSGASKDGQSISPSPVLDLSRAVIGITGRPPIDASWAQFRALGAASLDLCAVAEGALDGFMTLGGSGLHVWDYVGALLIGREAGVVFGEANGDDLVIRNDALRFPRAAGTHELLAGLATLR